MVSNENRNKGRAIAASKVMLPLEKAEVYKHGLLE